MGTKHNILMALWWCAHMYAHKGAMCMLLHTMCTAIYLSQIKSDFHQTWNLVCIWGTEHKILTALWCYAHMNAHKGEMCTLLLGMCTIIYISQIKSDFQQALNLRLSLGTKHNIILELWWCAQIHAHKGAMCMLLHMMCTVIYLSQIKSAIRNTTFGTQEWPCFTNNKHRFWDRNSMNACMCMSSNNFE